MNTRGKAIDQGPRILSSASNGGAREFRDLGLTDEGKAKISGAGVIMGRNNKSKGQRGEGHCSNQLELASINVKHPNPTEEESKTGPSQDPL